MRKYIKMALLIVAAFILMPLNIVWAFADTDVLQVYISEQRMTAFTNTELRENELSVLVSNQSAEITATGRLSDDNALIRTTVLIDISTSMPSAMRGNVIETLNAIVERKLPNEEFMIAVFGPELITLQGFTADRFDLALAIGEVNFNGYERRKYEAIFNTIPNINSVDGRPTFHRTIVITNGVDNASTGITREELFLRLQNDLYPIDIISVSDREVEENRELAAITRISGGRYFALNPNTNAVALADALGVGNYFFIEATVPSEFLDGVTRQVDISDGANSINVDVRFPIFVAQTINEAPSVESENGTDDVPLGYTSAVDIPQPHESNNTIIIILISAGVALVLILAVAIPVMVARKRREKRIHQPTSSPKAGKTEFVGGGDFTTQYSLKITKTDDASKNWILTVAGDVIIGREDNCAITLDDTSVSREQCKIVLSGFGLAVTNLSATNKTILNGKNVTNTAPLNPGDTLKFGRVALRIDYIQALGQPPSPQNKARTPGSIETEAIWK